VNRVLLEHAAQQQVEKGRMVRLDATVVGTHIHQFRTNESPAVISLYRALEEAGRLAGRGRGEVLNYETADY
jgi:hypothetical protein